jgi:hypothetical protein
MFVGVCDDHPCPFSPNASETGECPGGCLIEHYTGNKLNMKKDINKNVLINEEESYNEDIVDKCILDPCAKYTDDICLVHTEDVCFPTSTGCRFFFYF